MQYLRNWFNLYSLFILCYALAIQKRQGGTYLRYIWSAKRDICRTQEWHLRINKVVYEYCNTTMVRRFVRLKFPAYLRQWLLNTQ